MILNINGQNENVLIDSAGDIDLLDFAYLVEKYMGNEACDHFTKAVSNLYSEVDGLLLELNKLSEELESSEI